MTKTNELKAYLVRREMSFEQLAKILGISRVTLSKKVNNKVPFYATEIIAIQKALEMSNEERDYIFLMVG